MKTKILLGLTILSLLFIGSCKDKDDDNSGPAKTKTENLCSSPWITTSMTISPAINIGGTQISDWFAQFDACEKDDKMKYESNKTGIYDEGATKCSASDPQTEPFTWSFDLTETKLTQDGETFDIAQLDGSTLILKAYYDGDEVGGTPGVQYTLTMTMKH